LPGDDRAGRRHEAGVDGNERRRDEEQPEHAS
jgi:hypothetical protein